MLPSIETGFFLPENNNLERQNAGLKERIAQLEKTEPRFRIELVDDEGGILERLDLEHIVYDPLPDETIESLMEFLITRFPKATDFGPREPNPKNHNLIVLNILASREVYIPARKEEIDRYSNRDYPNWLRECREALSGIHDRLQLSIEPRFAFAISNEGTYPGKDALVNIVAEGNFKIYVPPNITESEKLSQQEPMIPTPPAPPRGRRSSLYSVLNRSMNFRNLLRDPFILSPSAFQADQRRDPNGFFYKPRRPITPGDTITLECEQWRHDTGDELFTGRISIGPTVQEMKGALTCKVQAENLSEPVEKLIPVRIAIKRVDSVERARELIEDLEYGSQSK